MERRAIAIEGIVQGVGFRPFVHGLATRLALSGFVRNRSGGVWIEVEGDAAALDCFLSQLSEHPPPLAQIAHVAWEPRPLRGDRHFHIESSETDDGPIFIGPDAGTCAACVAELFDLADRRYRYPFLNCTHCGPRLTIITGAPYDRERTTMAGFAMCPACRGEYDDPTNRRFHAQPTACPACGPALELRGEIADDASEASKNNFLDVKSMQGAVPAALGGHAVQATCPPKAAGMAPHSQHPGMAPLAGFARALLAGKVGALKSLGGFHLACDASNAAPVALLRLRKHRDEKPFAVMVGDLASARMLCEIDAAEGKLLESAARPIVLLRKRRGAPVADGVAPGNPFLGVMLPSTPVHFLLLDAVGGRPLVMTSGNRSDEPIAYENGDALERLRDLADVFLLNNRPIHVRCDDSVTRMVDGVELPLRRSRGYAPRPIALPFACARPILAVGGQMKATFALGRDRSAILSHHLGDLDQYDAFRAFVKDVALYEQLFSVEPVVLAHDLHPDYASTRYAETRIQEAGGKMVGIGVQHHHAHLASGMAEHGLNEPVIGITFDGTGHGTDGAIWGGEFLTGDYRDFQRAAHLRYVGMPGGDQAVREPWRMALAHLHAAGVNAPDLERRIGQESWRVIARMVERGLRCPPTSSIGRLFDAVAALAGVRDHVHFEGQAAMELEWLATDVPDDGAYAFDMVDRSPIIEIDPRPLIRGVVEDVGKAAAPSRIARRFHSALVEMIVAVCTRVRERTGLNNVVLSGGVFLNVLLTREVMEHLTRTGFVVFRQCRVPPGDGGLSLGQLAIAAARCAIR